MNFNNQYRPGGFGGLPVVTKNIIIINVILYVTKYVALRSGVSLDNYLSLHHYLAPSFKPHQFVTYLFMHADPMHLLLNMFGVYVFGQALETLWGPKRYLIFYVVTGLGAALTQYIILSYEVSKVLTLANAWFESPGLSAVEKNDILNQKFAFISSLDNAPILGASGSLFGLLGAFGMLFPNTEMRFNFIIPIKAKWLVFLYGGLELVLAIKNDPRDPVAHFAHLGGLAVGIIFILIWRKDRNHFY